MNLSIQIQPYALPLTSAWPTRRRNPITQRRGWIVRIQAEQYHGWGDCPPFSEAGTETLDQASKLLHQLAKRQWSGEQSLLAELKHHQHSHPAVCYALETAWLDLLGKYRRQPIHQLISTAANACISVNALCGSICHENTSQAQKQGFSVLKIKVGIEKPATEIACLKKLVMHLPPRIQLRLDANGAWNTKEAHVFLEEVRNLPIESIEEPLHNPSLQDFSHLQSQTPVLLALDESLSGFELEQVLSTPHIRRLVLKPAAHGGLLNCYSIAQRAAKTNTSCVVTTVVDSAIGVQATAHLASAINSLFPGLTHGLATSSWLSKNIASPPKIRAGYISLSNKPGLGIDEIF
jgi:o-succinylbenzoate synthase